MLPPPTYLEDALLFEEKGWKLYTTLVAETKMNLSKKLFTSLAEQEKYHMAYIKSYTHKLTMKKVKFNSLESEIKKVFLKLQGAMRNKDLSQITGLEKALQMEKEGYALYKKAYTSATTKADKDFFTYLMGMEDEHYGALANLYYYYTNNPQWTSEDESKVWNWMNF